MTPAQLTRVRELIAQVRDNLNDEVDVDTEVGDGTVRHRISPYQSVAFDIRSLEEALYLLRDADAPPRQVVQIADPETSFPVFVDAATG